MLPLLFAVPAAIAAGSALYGAMGWAEKALEIRDIAQDQFKAYMDAMKLVQQVKLYARKQKTHPVMEEVSSDISSFMGLPDGAPIRQEASQPYILDFVPVGPKREPLVLLTTPTEVFILNNIIEARGWADEDVPKLLAWIIVHQAERT